MKIKFFLFFLILSTFSFGQEMLQIGITGSNNQIRVINLHEDGMVLLDKAPNGLLKIKRIDKDLNMVWDVESELLSKESFLEDYYDGRFLYILLDQRNSDNYSVLKISASFAAIQKINIKTVANFELSHFKASTKSICLGGSVKSEPFLIFMEEGSNIPKYITANLKGEAQIQSLDFTDEKVVVNFLNKNKKKSQIVVREFSFSGKVLNTEQIQNTEKYEFLSVKYFQNTTQRLLLGNYGFGSTNLDGIKSSQGIYVVDLNNANKIKYYSFENFKNIFGFLTDKQQERLRKQVEKKKDKGNEFIFNYRLTINEVIPDGDNLLISAEVYMPEFRNNSMSTPYLGGNTFYPSGLWGRQYLSNYYWMNSPAFWGYRNRSTQIFDGFKYLEGTLISLNADGKINWDNAMLYKNVRYYQLKSHSKVSMAAENPIVYYVSDNKFYISEFDNNGNKNLFKEYDNVKLNLGSKSKKSEFENLEHWYDNYFLNWGVQKDNDAKIGYKQVCFIQKIPINK
ncbi:MAG: hypothetical protein LCH67_13920 [Bacteroidetes bacterium]|nr:hypothetical protein [Bacteroidota bacterium]